MSSNSNSSKRSYQSAAEFDDAALARKREYWRSKKREQRARISSAKKKIGNENLGCLSIFSDELSLQVPKVCKNPSLRNHDLSCKLEDVPKNSFTSGLSVSESNVTTVPCQKERWFHKTRIKHVLPQFQETSTNSLKAVINYKKLKSSVTGSSNTDAKTVESLTPQLVPTTCIKLHRNSTQKKTSNGKQMAMSWQRPVPSVLPMHSKQNAKPQNRLQPLTFTECKVHEDHGFVQSPVTKRKTCAFVSEHNTRVTQTEEEIAAKRRENWRIQKREQRAKRAAKLAWDRERSLRQGHPSSALSPANNKALRGVNLNLASPIFLSQLPLGSKCSLTQQHNQGSKPNHASLSSGILQPCLCTTQTLNKSKVPKFTHTQKKCPKQNGKPVLGASKVESPEDRHARKKEYWRMKKREQRSRQSVALKAQMKELEQPKLCRKHNHKSLNWTNGVKVNAFACSSESIGGFIQGDGTVKRLSKTAPEPSLPSSHNPSNTNCNGKVKLQVQVCSPQPVSKLFSTPCNFINAQENTHSRLTRRAVMGSMTVTIQSETLTEEERIAHLREYWRIKKREQRASRAARLGNGLLRSKVLVLKRREQNKKSNQRLSVTSFIDTTVCDSSTSAPNPIKEEHVYPTIQAVFSIPQITPCNNVKESKSSMESHIEPPTAADYHATTLQAVASMKKILEESVCMLRDQNSVERNSMEMHVKIENEPILLTIDELPTSEDEKKNVTLQQNLLLECEVSSIKLESPQASTFDTSISQKAADESHALSPVAVQPQCRNNQMFSSDGADPTCLSQALQKQQFGESDELQRKREYWRLIKRQQRARKAKKEAARDAVLRSLASQTPLEKKPRQVPIPKKIRACSKSAGPRTQPADKSKTNKPNSQQDPEEVIRRRRMQWRIKKQEQRARKAAHQRKIHQTMAPPLHKISQDQSTTILCPPIVQSIKSEDQLCYPAEPYQTTLKEETSFAPNDATEGALSQDEWRHVYLMDFDPVNPLLVCMVCGAQQYSLSVEEVKAHIQDVHPDTLSQGDLERQGILEAWDKQVAVREHFITHQLQQRRRASTVNRQICIQSGLENKSIHNV